MVNNLVIRHRKGHADGRSRVSIYGLPPARLRADVACRRFRDHLFPTVHIRMFCIIYTLQIRGYCLI